ncbi:predicted protein [Nematostella vectensis]|uniref:Uncharacterized protein n=1 Tax=Nematostella vectensis TaxID=45351 RepID=A7SFQ7_NEMVE|nr:predicted protein [Nematostella vectensis]|eukprot:XP_001629513.1 predicted protein [Nematostella vectensis]
MGIVKSDSSFLTDSFLENNPHGEYPDRFPCYYTRLRKAQTQSDDATNTSDTQPTRCRKHEPSPSACEEANTQYGNPDYLPPLRQCSYEGIPNICNVTRTNRAGFDLACDVTSCKGSQVYIARVNPNMGTVTAWKVIEPFDVIRVKDIAVKAQDEGFSFLYLQCRGFLQVLGLPPKLLIGSPVPYDRRLNINIVVVDSVARTHFFRAMKRSVSAMREIIYDDTIPATVLDFESFQAISMHTFDNIRPLFSGVTKVNNHFSRKASKTLHPLGINVLYGHYKKHGYQTIFQEDLCWQDSWGIMLNNLQQHGDGQDNGQIPLMDAKRWSDFQHVVKSHQIDHLGLTHFSCEVLMQYNRKNPYDGPGHVCLNGLYYSIYFLRYIALMTREIARDFHAAPLISYQHLNTGHTDWGTRVTNDDEPLAQFLNAMAHDPNTLTIVLSDHGHTRTPYASTDEGQNELYSPFLFMVLPNHVASLLGKQRVEALVKNQQRIFTTLDLHKALMSLHSTDKPSSDYKQAGIFAKIPADRTCSDLPLSPLARCRCEGWDEKAEKNSPRIKWLAEFAVGALNDLIQEQYVKGLNPSTWNRRSVPGNCVRLLGKSFSNIRQRRDAQKNLLTTFDLHVTAHTSVPLIEDEVFKVAISHGETWAVLQSYSRHTLYNKYKYCADRHVNLKLCICRKKRVRSPEYMKEVISSGMFGSETSVKDIYNGCVFLTSRSHDGLTVVYELANLCTQTKNVIIYGEPYYMQVSKQLPFSIRAEPNTVYFVISGVRRMLEFSYLDLATIVENDESIAKDVFTRPSLYQRGATT